MRRRVVVTGIGLVSPFGTDPTEVFESVCAGVSAVSLDPDSGLPIARSAFDAERRFVGERLSGIDRVSQFAIAAAEDACRDASWSIGDARDRVGVYVGTGFGGTTAIAEGFRRFYADERMPPLTIVGAMANAPAAHVAMRLGIHGPVMTYAVACASSSVAIAAGAKDIAIGDVDVALVGGAEAQLLAPMLSSWDAMRTLADAGGDASSACRPFSATRRGLVLGEGAAFLVLEPEDEAVRRGAPIYAELAGAGVSCDASHLTKPDVDGQVRAMRAAIGAAGLRVEDIGYCNAHGTATIAGDEVEAQAIRTLWGDASSTLRVSSTKALHGHLLGAAGALEASITVLAVHCGTLPPNAHCGDPDPRCDLPLIRAAEHRTLRAAICNSFAFGGTNSSLVFSAYDPSPPDRS